MVCHGKTLRIVGEGAYMVPSFYANRGVMVRVCGRWRSRNGVQVIDCRQAAAFSIPLTVDSL